MRTTKTAETPGRARVVLASANDDAAAVTTILVEPRTSSPENRIRFAGDVTVAEATASHVREGILPIMDTLCSGLGIPPQLFTIRVFGLAAATAKDVPLQLSGYSADLPMLLAMISCVLGFPLPLDVLATGHVASPAGDITMVRSLPEKIAAAVADPDIHMFLYPSLAQDHSLPMLAPMEKNRIEDALVRASELIRVVPVRTVLDAMKLVFDEGAIALASLDHGFWDIAYDEKAGILDAVVRYFAEGNEGRFWRALEEDLSRGHEKVARKRLRTLIAIYAKRRAYPSGIGARLHSLLASLPPSKRRARAMSPLISLSDCTRASRHAKEADHGDVVLLHEASLGKLPAASSLTGRVIDPGAASTGNAAADMILYELSGEHLAATVGTPIDEARERFELVSAQVGSYDEFLEIMSSFYARLECGSGATANWNPDHLLGGTLALLERAFAREGGIAAACTEARQPTRLGGCRHVLNVVTDQYKAEALDKRVLLKLNTAIDPLKYEEKVALIETLLARLRPLLPREVADKPAEYYAKEWETLARAYAHSLDAVTAVLRRL